MGKLDNRDYVSPLDGIGESGREFPPQKYVCSIDWFQYFGHIDTEHLPIVGSFVEGKTKNQKGYTCMYEVIDGREKHPIYRNSYTILLHGFAVAHIFAVPKSSAIDRRACGIKMSNRILYTSSWGFHLRDVAESFGIELKSLTRVDVACDFQRFSNGWLPCYFIRRYLGEEINGENATLWRKSSNKFAVHGIKKTIPVEDGQKGEIAGATTSWDYIRWGTRNSGVCTYLYDKSKELREKKQKPYIQEMWQKAGIIQEEDVDVYRLEFSIIAKGSMVKKRTKKLMKSTLNIDAVRSLCTDDFTSQKKIEEIFFTYASEYFAFVQANGNKFRKDWDKISLFDANMETDLKPVSMSKSWDCGRTETIACNCLEKLSKQYPDMDSQSATWLRKAAEVLANISVAKHNLHLDFVAENTLAYMGEMKQANEQMEANLLSEDEREIFENEPWVKLMRGMKISPKYAESIKNYVQLKVKEALRPYLADSKCCEAIQLCDVERMLTREWALLEIEAKQHPEKFYDEIGRLRDIRDIY